MKNLKRKYSGQIHKSSPTGELGDILGKTIVSEKSDEESDFQESLEIDSSDSCFEDTSESSFDSEASRINFWRDINTADEEY
jgi:hypothetical protein